MPWFRVYADAVGRFAEVYRHSLDQPENFWAEAAAAIDWVEPWQRVLDDSQAPFYRWFTGGRLNTCHNALDRHVDGGRAEQPALVYDSPVTETSTVFSYRELRDAVALFAGALAAQGVERGDRVVIYMPMVPEAVIAMLACARIGAVHSVVFGGFAANELASRIEDAKPKVVVAASCGIEPGRVVAYKPLLDAAIDLSTFAPQACIVLQRPMLEAELVAGRDLDWNDAVAAAEPAACVVVDATDPLYILYTSGTTGQPKGIVRDNGGHAVALAWSMKNVYDVEPGEVYWAASDVGWVVGHSYIVYGPLLHGCTTVLYEGKPVGTPDAGAFWRVVAEHGVSTLFTAPTAFRAIRQQDPEGAQIGRYDLSSLRALFLAGERCDPETLRWAERLLDVPVIDHWWQTETGWSIVANCLGIERLPVVPGSPTRPVPGWDVRVLDPAGAEEGGRTLPRDLPLGVPRLLPDRRRGFHRRRWLRVRHGADGRHHQRRRPPSLHGRNGGGARLASGRSRVRRDRRRRRAEGAAAGRLPRPQGRGRTPGRGDRRRGDGARPERDRPGRGVQDRRGRRAAAEDALREDPARDDASHRRRRGVLGAGDHRRPGHPSGDHRHAGAPRVRQRGRPRR
jgi:acyl-coenzyme A synthetase/AMP-(fatty) acid ligase